MSFSRDLKNVFARTNNGVVQLIVVCSIVFVIANIIEALYPFSVYYWMGMPSGTQSFIHRPWTLFTYIFTHLRFWHILFNMLWLFWMGKLFSEYLGNVRFVATFILGGIAGGILFLVFAQLFPYYFGNQVLIGASAGVMAVVVGIATLLPDYSVHLVFLGPVRLKYIALISFVLSTLIDLSVNTGGKIAHAGGALYGLIYVSQYKRGTDLAKWITDLFGKRKIKVAYTRYKDVKKESKADTQKKIDTILDKISRSGYESLTREEKDFLFKMSNDKPNER